VHLVVSSLLILVHTLDSMKQIQLTNKCVSLLNT